VVPGVYFYGGRCTVRRICSHGTFIERSFTSASTTKNPGPTSTATAVAIGKGVAVTALWGGFMVSVYLLALI
jgi:hypothetical protein